MERELSIVLKLRDQLSNELSTVGTNLERLKPQFKTMAAVGTASFGALSAAIGISVRETMANEAAQNRLSHILRTSRGATDEQVSALHRQARALEQVGVASGQSITQTQAQLATFDLSTEAIERLTPAILDYVVAEKGAAASTEDFRALTNGLAQALQGNFASLTRTGFVLDDVTKDLISNGNEAERTAALVDVLNSTYKGFNEAARDTAEGSLIALNNEFGNLKDTIGQQFTPVLVEMTKAMTPAIMATSQWIQENPVLFKQFTILGLALSGSVATLGIIGLTLPKVIEGYRSLGVAWKFLAKHPGLIALTTAAAATIAIYNAYMKTKSALDNAMGSAGRTRDVASELEKTLPNLSDEEREKRERLIQQANMDATEAERLGGLGILGSFVEGFKGMTETSRERLKREREDIQSSPVTQFNFTFNGDVNDQEKLIRNVQEALNRESTLRFSGGL